MLKNKRFILWQLLIEILAVILGIGIGWTIWGNKNEEVIVPRYQSGDLFVGEVRSIITPDSVRETVTVRAMVTAYTSSPDETNGNPFITASGEKTRDGIVANNCLEFGEKVEIDGGVFEVQDRMSVKYGCEYFDIWMENKQEAKEFGKQVKLVLVYK